MHLKDLGDSPPILEKKIIPRKRRSGVHIIFIKYTNNEES
jgi:hypothetical protein